MDIKASLTGINELTDDELASLETEIVDTFGNIDQENPTQQSVEQMTELADGMDLVTAEKSRRVTEAAVLSDRAAEASSRINMKKKVEGEDVADAPTDGDTDGDTDVPGEVDIDPEADPKKKKKNPFDKGGATFALETLDASEAEEPAPSTESLPEPTADSPAPEVEAVEAETEVAEPEVIEPEAEAEVAPSEELDATDGDATETTNDDDDDNTPEPDADADGETTETTQEENMTASASQAQGSINIEAPVANAPKQNIVPMSITAGADIPNVAAGSTLSSMDGVAEAFTKRMHTLRHVTGGDGEQHIVASLHYDYPEDRVLQGSDPLANQKLIDGVTGREALVAAAGVCVPLETNYDMACDVGVTDRPVRDSLARFNADRGGIRYFTTPQLEDYSAATGFWGIDGVTRDYKGDLTVPAGLKPCLEVQCPEEKTAFIAAITLCLTFSNLTGRVWPELIKRQNELALVQHARIAENSLLSQIEKGSTKVEVASTTVGATRELLNLLARSVATYRHKNRMNNVSPLRMLAPSWLRELIRADIALQMPGDGLDEVMALADTKINAWFRARNVNITWHLDGVGPTMIPGDAAPGDDPDTDVVETDYTGPAKGFQFPTNLEFALFAEGTWLFLDGGTMDLGLIRDSSLIAQNQYKQFVETFESAVNVGCESYWITAPYKATGAAAALVATGV